MPAIAVRRLGRMFLCTPATDPYDKRYQRPWWFRVPRWLVQRPYLSLIAYLGATFRDSFLSLWHQGPNVLEPSKLIQALRLLWDQIKDVFLGYIAPWVTHNPLVFTLLVLVVLFVAWVASRAWCDTVREKAVLTKRLMQDQMAHLFESGDLPHYNRGFADGFGKGFSAALDLKERRYLDGVGALAGGANVQRQLPDIEQPIIDALGVGTTDDDTAGDDPAP